MDLQCSSCAGVSKDKTATSSWLSFETLAREGLCSIGSSMARAPQDERFLDPRAFQTQTQKGIDIEIVV